MNELVTGSELAEARNDPAFRQEFLAKNLGRLLEALKITRRANARNPKTERQIKEGADLEVKLADRLHNGGRGNWRNGKFIAGSWPPPSMVFYLAFL